MGGYVCNVAISRYATVTITRGHADAGAFRPSETSAADRAIVEAAARRFRMHDARIEVHSDFPIGAGLGGSSAAGVATIAALAAARHERLTPPAFAELSRAMGIADLAL